MPEVFMLPPRPKTDVNVNGGEGRGEITYPPDDVLLNMRADSD